jgi:hypothetical protein
LNCTGTLDIVDDENFGDNETRRVDITEQSTVTSNNPSSFFWRDECCGDEVRVTLKMDASLSGNDIKLSGEWVYYEGESCSTDDRHDSGKIDKLVPRDGTGRIDVKSEDGAGGFHLVLTCNNTVP